MFSGPKELKPSAEYGHRSRTADLGFFWEASVGNESVLTESGTLQLCPLQGWQPPPTRSLQVKGGPPTLLSARAVTNSSSLPVGFWKAGIQGETRAVTPDL